MLVESIEGHVDIIVVRSYWLPRSGLTKRKRRKQQKKQGLNKQMIDIVY
jgi:hypothetical protein